MKDVPIDYPRPQFMRNQWQNLNGTWKFAFDDPNRGEVEGWPQSPAFDQTINVPFSYESEASGIGEETFHPFVWYAREFQVEHGTASDDLLLHFQASDYLTKVWINGNYVGQHAGGNSSFTFDITAWVTFDTPNTLVIKVEDSQDVQQPRGKQRWEEQSFGCWYVQTTGIWQTVWLECVPKTRLKRVKMTPDIRQKSVHFDFELEKRSQNEVSLQTDILFQGEHVHRFSFDVSGASHSMTVNIAKRINDQDVMLWSPAHPHLYDVQFRLFENGQPVDSVQSYFGMRDVSIKGNHVLLNNVPIYQKLILDQGYWPETMLTPPSEQALIDDIDAIIEMGYNGVRKHQKLEDERFLYWCDRKGLLVWSEMAATYDFTDRAMENITNEWLKIVHQHYNHPSIITWVPFNESWGIEHVARERKQQRFTEAIYYLTKAIDPMRPVIVNDGWEHTISDIITLHDYDQSGNSLADRYEDIGPLLANEHPHNKVKFAMADGYSYRGQPIIISEYGGIAFQAESGWGYGNPVCNDEEYLTRFRALTEAIKNNDAVCGYCYTQLSDVQHEINGILTADRRPKVSLEKIRETNE